MTALNGHFSVIGLEELDGLWLGMPLLSIIEKASRAGAAVIFLHHHLEYSHFLNSA